MKYTHIILILLLGFTTCLRAQSPALRLSELDHLVAEINFPILEYDESTHQTQLLGMQLRPDSIAFNQLQAQQDGVLTQNFSRHLLSNGGPMLTIFRHREFDTFTAAGIWSLSGDSLHFEGICPEWPRLGEIELKTVAQITPTQHILLFEHYLGGHGDWNVTLQAYLLEDNQMIHLGEIAAYETIQNYSEDERSSCSHIQNLEVEVSGSQLRMTITTENTCRSLADFEEILEDEVVIEHDTLDLLEMATDMVLPGY